MGLEMLLIQALVNDPEPSKAFNVLLNLGLRSEMFRESICGNVWTEITGSVNSFGKVPDATTLELIFPGNKWGTKPPEAPAFYAAKVLARERHNVLVEAGRKLNEKLDHDDLEGAEKALTSGIEASSTLAQVSIAFDGGEKLQTDERISSYNQRRSRTMIDGIATPWECLSEYTFGWHNEELVLIVGRTSVGKTWLELMCAHACWKDGKIPLIASMEMSKTAMLKRWDSINFGLPYDHIKKGRLGRFQEIVYASKLEELAKDQAAGNVPPFLVAESRAVRTVPELASLVRRYNPDMVFVDGAYLLRDQLRATAIWERVTNIADELVMLGSDFKKPVMATVQFNKQVNVKKMSGGMENIGLSDRLGQNCHVAIGLFQNKDLRGRKEAFARLLKNRDGDLVEWTLKWDFDLMKFEEMASRRVGSDDPIFLDSDEEFVDDPVKF
jgi:replicative DNA helicase